MQGLPLRSCTASLTGCMRQWRQCGSKLLPADATSVHARIRVADCMTAAWDGAGSQHDLMRKDQCIVVDETDQCLGHASKADVHRFDAHNPRGVLHRAFSVFLFNCRSELLLQQRAAEKVTFPGVWTNTCCSHPLHGQNPPELDDREAIADGTVIGAKRAAVRKLKHELGIASPALHPGAFRYLTRLHYCARDTTGGAGGGSTVDAGWGEHEMDYILFARADVDIRPNPAEVAATAFVSREGLRRMMDPERGLSWSPWFRIICDRFLDGWWADLDRTLQTDDMQDLRTIHSIL